MCDLLDHLKVYYIDLQEVTNNTLKAHEYHIVERNLIYS